MNNADVHVAEANRDLADLHTISKAHSKMPGGGGYLGEIGKMGIRGGVGSAVGYQFGGPKGAAVGGLGLGPGLNPRVLSGIVGFGGGRAAQATPSALRLYELLSELQRQNELEE